MNDKKRLTIALATNQILTKLTVIASKKVRRITITNQAIHIFTPPTLIIRNKLLENNT